VSELDSIEDLEEIHTGLDKEFTQVALPAFISLAADPMASLVDAMYVGRLGAVEQAGMGIAISAQFSVAKLYNDPLLKTSTSLVAGKTGEELSASVATAILTAMIIGVMQCLLFLFASGPIMSVMGVGPMSEMRSPALKYLRFRALGVPAATVLIVSNGIFRGRGDTRTPLYCTILGNVVNIILDPILIFNCGMGCAGAGAATSISQWVAATPLLYMLYKKTGFSLTGQKKGFFRESVRSYVKAGSLIMLRTVSKIGAYTVTSSAAARLGTIPMAAYSLTFNLGFATSQLCEAVSIAAQALLARDVPYNTPRRRASASHVIRRALQGGLLVSSILGVVTMWKQDAILASMTKSLDVRAAAAAVMPMVLFTQIWKSLAYSTGGILLGGLDWWNSSLGMQVSALLCVGIVWALPSSLWNIWIALAVFMATQVIMAGHRFLGGKDQWAGLDFSTPAYKRGQGRGKSSSEGLLA
jgi:putative MATE family efflux protein